MNRRVFAFICLLATVFLPAVLTGAQQPKKVYRIGYLASQSGLASNREAFRQGLRELGYIEGQNLVIEYRYAEKPERFPELASELVRLKMNALLAANTPATLALKDATGTSPIVFAAAPNPLGTRMVGHLAHPGGNVTGLSSLSPELSRKRLELFKETFPEASRAGVILDPTSPLDGTEWSEAQLAARALKITLVPLEVRGPKDFELAFQTAAKEQTRGLIVLRSALANDLQKRLVELAAKGRMPAIYNDRSFTEAGGLMSFGPDVSDLFRRAATYVDKILKGTKPADFPVQGPTKFDLVINLKTAKQLDLTIPPNVLARADRVIKGF